MLATRVRVSPCSARCFGSSDGRWTVMFPSSSAIAISGCRRRSSSPRGPFTFTVCPSTVAVTFFGTGTGFLPIRDIDPLLPDHGEQLAAGARLTSLTVGHQPLRGAEDRHAEPVPNARDLAHAHVAAEPRGGHALQLANDRLLAGGVLEIHAQQLPALLGVEHLEVFDVRVLQEDLDWKSTRLK